MTAFDGRGQICTICNQHGRTWSEIDHVKRSHDLAFERSLDLLSLTELESMTARARRESVKCWREYGNAPDGNLAGSDQEVAEYRVKQMLNESAWSETNYWRTLYDALKARKQTEVTK